MLSLDCMQLHALWNCDEYFCDLFAFRSFSMQRSVFVHVSTPVSTKLEHCYICWSRTDEKILGLGSNMDQGWAMNKAVCEAIGRPKLFATSLWTRTSTIHAIGNPKTMNHHNFTRTRIWSTYRKQVYISVFLLTTSYHIVLWLSAGSLVKMIL